MTPPREPKRPNLLYDIKEFLAAGTIRYSVHALKREGERAITAPEVNYALKHGWHEARKDKYEANYTHPWTYSIRGKTVDERRLRIAVTFEADDDADGAEELLLVVTLIDLDLETR